MSEASKPSGETAKPSRIRPHAGESARHRNGRTPAMEKGGDRTAHVSFKVYGEDAKMARIIGRFSSFSHVCLHALRAYHQLVRKFYGPWNPLSPQTDRLAPPPYECLLVPATAEKFQELAALSRRLEASTGAQITVEQLMARAVEGVTVEKLEEMADPFPKLAGELFEIYSEHSQKVKPDA